MNTSVIQTYIYRVKSSQSGSAARAKAMQSMKAYKGFRSWQAMVDPNDTSKFTDILEWDNSEAANAAEATYMDDPETSEFRQAVDEVLYTGNNKVIAIVSA